MQRSFRLHPTRSQPVSPLCFLRFHPSTRWPVSAACVVSCGVYPYDFQPLPVPVAAALAWPSILLPTTKLSSLDEFLGPERHRLLVPTSTRHTASNLLQLPTRIDNAELCLGLLAASTTRFFSSDFYLCGRVGSLRSSHTPQQVGPWWVATAPQGDLPR